LQIFVPDYALGERKAGVAGGKDWTPHEWVIQCLDAIFGAQNWSDEIGQLTHVRTDDGELLLYVPVTLRVRFADGTLATRSDIGTGVVRKTKDEREAQRQAEYDGENDLGATPIDNYSTGYKSAVTSGLKGCCRDLGRIFIPMQSGWVASAITRRVLESDLERLVIKPDQIRLAASQTAQLPKPSDPEVAARLDFWQAVADKYLSASDARQALEVAGGDYHTAINEVEKIAGQKALDANKDALGRDSGELD
jgi:hypothetical protein